MTIAAAPRGGLAFLLEAGRGSWKRKLEEEEASQRVIRAPVAVAMAAADGDQVIHWLNVAPDAPANTVAWAAHGLVAVACQHQTVLLVRVPAP